MNLDACHLKIQHWAFDRRLLTILLIVFVQMIGASMVHPILPLFAQSEFSMEPQAITLLLTAFFGAQFLAGPFIGRWSDRRGRLPVLLISQVGTVFAFLMIGFSQSVALLFSARILDGITGGNIVVAMAYVTDIMPESKRTQALGYVMAAFGLGFIVGPAMGGVLASELGPRVPFIVAAAAAFITVMITWLTLEETLSPEDQARNRGDARARIDPATLMTNVPLMAVMCITFVGRFGFGLLIGTFALFAEEVLFAGYDLAAVSLGVGLLLMLVGVGQFFTQILLLPAAINRVNDPAIVLLGSIARALALFILAVAAGPYLAGLSMALFAVGSGLLMPALQSLVTKTVSQALRGAILGVHQSVMNLAVILSTAVSGVLFAFDPTLPNWLGAILYSLSLAPGILLWLWARNNAIEEGAGVVVSTQ